MLNTFISDSRESYLPLLALPSLAGGDPFPSVIREGPMGWGSPGFIKSGRFVFIWLRNALSKS